MNPEEIGESYDRIANFWNGDDFNRGNGIDAHMRAIRFVDQPGPALDVGCGSSGRFVDLLIESGFSVEGLDISKEMIRLARERHPLVAFHCIDVCRWKADKHYSLVTAWDSIWHLDIARQESVLRTLCVALEEGGVLIFTAGGTYSSKEKSAECMGQPVYYGVLGIPRLLDLLSSVGMNLCHLEFDQYPEKHLYVVAKKRSFDPGRLAGQG